MWILSLPGILLLYMYNYVFNCCTLMFTSSMCSILAATFRVDAPILFCVGCSLFLGYRIFSKSMFISKLYCSFTILSLSLQNSMLKVDSNINVFHYVILKQLYALLFSDLSYYYERLEAILKSYINNTCICINLFFIV